MGSRFDFWLFLSYVISLCLNPLTINETVCPCHPSAGDTWYRIKPLFAEGGLQFASPVSLARALNTKLCYVNKKRSCFTILENDTILNTWQEDRTSAVWFLELYSHEHKPWLQVFPVNPGKHLHLFGPMHSPYLQPCPQIAGGIRQRKKREEKKKLEYSIWELFPCLFIAEVQHLPYLYL